MASIFLSLKIDFVLNSVWAGFVFSSGLEVMKLFSCLTQLNMKLIVLISVKMTTIVGISTFISMIDTTSDCLKAKKGFIFQHFSSYELLKFHA